MRKICKNFHFDSGKNEEKIDSKIFLIKFEITQQRICQNEKNYTG